MLSSLRHYWNIFKQSLRHEKGLVQHHYSFEEAEFLPSVLGMQEQPPSPIGRIITGLIIGFLIIVVVWATIGKVDVITTAQGKIIQVGKSKVIQPVDTGKITAIYVHEGKHVNKGDVLIELDTSETKVDEKQAMNELIVERLKYAAQKTILYSIEHKAEGKQLKEFIEPEFALEHGTRFIQAKKYVENRISEYEAKKSMLNNSILKYRSELSSLRLNISRLESTLPLAKKKSESYKKAIDKEVVPEHQYMSVLQSYYDLKGEYEVSKQRVNEINASINSAIDEKENVKQELRRELLLEQNEAEKRIVMFEQELKKAQLRTEDLILISPTDGIVQQLSVNTIGGVVTPAQELMVIVPTQRVLEVEAWVQNKDIGFVEEGMIADVKIEPFPFTKYGVVTAKLKTLSQDAIQLEDVGFVFLVRVLLDKSAIWVSKTKQVNLSPGMNVTVEIKTGKRRVIEYFLTPIIKGFSTVARER